MVKEKIKISRTSNSRKFIKIERESVYILEKSSKSKFKKQYMNNYKKINFIKKT